MSLYYSIFLSFLSYCLLVWGFTCESYKLALFRLQKSDKMYQLRTSLFSLYSHISKASKLLKLEDLLKINILAFVFKDNNNLFPSCFQDYFIYNSKIHGYETRQVKEVIYIEKHRNTYIWPSLN